MTKFTALSHKNNLNGTILLGIDSTYKIEYINKNIKKGNTDLSWEKGDYPKIIISSKIAKKLEANINDTILFSFARIKKNSSKSDTTATFSNSIISGIYESNIKEFDEKICYVNMNYLRHKFKLNDNTISYYEVFTDDNIDIKKITKIINSPLIKVLSLNENSHGYINGKLIQ